MIKIEEAIGLDNKPFYILYAEFPDGKRRFWQEGQRKRAELLAKRINALIDEAAAQEAT